MSAACWVGMTAVQKVVHLVALLDEKMVAQMAAQRDALMVGSTAAHWVDQKVEKMAVCSVVKWDVLKVEHLVASMGEKLVALTVDQRAVLMDGMKVERLVER